MFSTFSAKDINYMQKQNSPRNPLSLGSGDSDVFGVFQPSLSEIRF